MIQIFFKKNRITESEWTNVYQNIVKISLAFPLKLERIDSYDGFNPVLDKLHENLIVQTGELYENISFWGDQMSYTAAYTVRFYKNWEIQKTKGLTGKETDESKPVAWFTPEVFCFSGYPPKANGCSFHHSYLDVGEATYKYAILAIGMMLENYLPGRVFMVALENTLEEIIETRKWLEGTLKEQLDIPVYFDKHRLIELLKNHYQNKRDLVGRLDILYMNQFRNNMVFAIENIGYQPSLEYYSHVLSNADFGTFGFSDILNPWISAINNLDNVLELVAKSLEILLSDKNNDLNIRKAAKYDYCWLLKHLLDNFILWTPAQRETLELFYTNKKALETGEEELIGSIMRISGYRIDICPFYANPDQLFEAFMFFDPKNGNEYQRIINDWIEKNKNAYGNLMNEIEQFEKLITRKIEKEEDISEKENTPDYSSAIRNFAKNFEEHEQFLVTEALKLNPAFMDVDNEIDSLRRSILNLLNNETLKQNIKYRIQLSREEKIRRIKATIKEKRLAVHQDFEDWIENVNDPNILTSLDLLVSLKIYQRGQAFARQQVLMNNKYWHPWKKGGDYEILLPDSNT
jgi:hypothetical protein